MTENEWTNSISNRLKAFCEAESLNADTLRKIPYSQEIIKYSDDWEPEYYPPKRFETDLVIYEKTEGMIVPRVMEKMLHDSRSSDRKHYYMLQKQLVLKEISDEKK